MPEMRALQGAGDVTLQFLCRLSGTLGVSRARVESKVVTAFGRYASRNGSEAVPNTSSQAARRATSASFIVAGMPSAARLVTPNCGSPQGMMPPKWERFGSTFSATPCQLTHRVTRTPMAPILDSNPVTGSATQMPTRPSRRSPLTLKRSSVRISHSPTRSRSNGYPAPPPARAPG